MTFRIGFLPWWPGPPSTPAGGPALFRNLCEPNRRLSWGCPGVFFLTPDPQANLPLSSVRVFIQRLGPFNDGEFLGRFGTWDCRLLELAGSSRLDLPFRTAFGSDVHPQVRQRYSHSGGRSLPPCRA